MIRNRDESSTAENARINRRRLEGQFNGRDIEKTDKDDTEKTVVDYMGDILPSDILGTIFSNSLISLSRIAQVSTSLQSSSERFLWSIFKFNYQPVLGLSLSNIEILPADFSDTPVLFRSLFLYAVKQLENNDENCRKICREYVKTVLLYIVCGIDTITLFGREEINDSVLRLQRIEGNIMGYFLIEFLKRYPKNYQRNNTILPPKIKTFLESIKLKEDFEIDCLIESNIDLWKIINLWKEKGCSWDIDWRKSTENEVPYEFSIYDVCKDLEDELDLNKSLVLTIRYLRWYHQPHNETIVIDARFNEKHECDFVLIAKFIERYILNQVFTAHTFEDETQQVSLENLRTFLDTLENHPLKDKFSHSISKIIFYAFNMCLYSEGYSHLYSLRLLVDFATRNLINTSQAVSLKNYVLIRFQDLLNSTCSIEFKDYLLILRLLCGLVKNDLVELNEDESNLCIKLIVLWFNCLGNLDKDSRVKSFLITVNRLFVKLNSKEKLMIEVEDVFLFKNELFKFLKGNGSIGIRMESMALFRFLLNSKKIKINKAEAAELINFVFKSLKEHPYFLDATYAQFILLLNYLLNENLLELRNLENENLVYIKKIAIHMIESKNSYSIDSIAIIDVLMRENKLVIDNNEVLVLKNWLINITNPEFHLKEYFPNLHLKKNALSLLCQLIFDDLIKSKDIAENVLFLKDCMLTTLRSTPRNSYYNCLDEFWLMIGLFLERNLLDLSQSTDDLTLLKNYWKPEFNDSNSLHTVLFALSFILEIEELFKLVLPELFEENYNSLLEIKPKYSESRKNSLIRFYELFLKHPDSMIHDWSVKIIEFLNGR